MPTDAVIAAARALLAELRPGCRCAYCGGDGKWEFPSGVVKTCSYCSGSGCGAGVESAVAVLRKALEPEGGT